MVPLTSFVLQKLRDASVNSLCTGCSRAHCEVTLVLSAREPDHHTLALPEPVAPAALVSTSIGPPHHSLARTLVVEPLTIVAATIGERHASDTVSKTVLEGAFIKATVRVFKPAASVEFPHGPVSFENSGASGDDDVPDAPLPYAVCQDASPVHLIIAKAPDVRPLELTASSSVALEHATSMALALMPFTLVQCSFLCSFHGRG